MIAMSYEFVHSLSEVKARAAVQDLLPSERVRAGTSAAERRCSGLWKRDEYREDLVTRLASILVIDGPCELYVVRMIQICY